MFTPNYTASTDEQTPLSNTTATTVMFQRFFQVSLSFFLSATVPSEE